MAAMPAKRTAPGDAQESPLVKQIKAEHPEEFSDAVKKRLQSSTRTGQACDRCKIRKIRCDGLPGGCSPCLQNNQDCRTTDRITGRATSRGYVEGIEQQNRDLQHKIQDLEQRLMQAGLDVKPSNYHESAAATYGYNTAAPAQDAAWNPSYPNQPADAVAPHRQQSNLFRALPAFRTGSTADNYLGVAPGNSHLSSIKGTALSILGMEIDIADFDSQDMDEPQNQTFHPQLYNKSYQAFLQSTLNVNPKTEKPDLPSREEGFIYVEWYFRALKPYWPLLHKPTFMKLLTRVYDDPAFKPTTAETVMVHMVFAIMFFQYATRNWEDEVQKAALNTTSNLHYHYSLSLFYDLTCSHTAQDVQALTLICGHLRNFPKPGASWILCQVTLAIALELGLHRSAKRSPPELLPNPLEVEMRKRTFWSLMAIHVTLSGKLGRPMLLRIEDYDVEIPEPIDDELLSEKGFDTSRPGKCLHKIGLQAYLVLPLYMEMYSTIYAVRRSPETYIATVSRLESKLRTWKENLPPELMNGELGSDEQEGRVWALYAQAWGLEFRLLLRHPSASMTTDAKFNAESMRICVESSRQMLSIVRQIQKFKSLDTTWYNTAVYVMAITTTLFAQWDKREDSTTADLAALREEMDLWLDIMGDIGALLGSGTRLQEAVRVVTDGTLGLLSRNLPNKAITAQQTKVVELRPPMALPPASTTQNTFPPQTYNFSGDSGASSSSTSAITNYMPQQTPYPVATQYSTYPEPATSTALTYASHEDGSYPHHFNTTDAVEAPLLAAFATQATQVAPNTWQRHQSLQGSSGSSAWQQWTSTMTGNLELQDCYSANALMSLGGRDPNSSDGGQQVASMSDMAANQAAIMNDSGTLANQMPPEMTMTWPLNLFNINQAGTGS